VGTFVRNRAPTAYLVDSVAPRAGVVLDGLPEYVEVDVSPSNETFAGAWRWWVDHESGIREFEVGLGTSPGAVDVQPWQSVGLETSVHMSFTDEQQLLHGVTYYLTVRATDNAGHQTVASSDGVIIDITPALPGSVVHHVENEAVRRFTNSEDELYVRWEDVEDPEVRGRGRSYATSIRTCTDGVCLSTE